MVVAFCLIFLSKAMVYSLDFLLAALAANCQEGSIISGGSLAAVRLAAMALLCS